MNKVKSQAIQRISEMEARLLQRLSELEARFNTRMDELEVRLNTAESRLSKDIRRNTTWMIGMMIPVWVGILIIALAQFI